MVEQVLYATVAQESGGSSGAPAGGQGGQPAQGCEQMGGFLLPMLLMFGIIYFLIIRPQQKQQKQHKAMISALKKGDKIVTNSGIFGTITGMTEATLTLEIAKNVHVRMLRGQIAGLQPGEKEDAAAPVVPGSEADKK
jgi:preprotein translocase subunit YajC